MFEYSSVSASSYDPGALVAKLNESAAEGWDVVAIVPTGGDVSAFMRRQVEAVAPSTDGPGGEEPLGVVEGGESWAATATMAESTEAPAEEAPAADLEPDVSAEAPSADAGPAEAAPSAVEEPPGWAAAPVETPEEIGTPTTEAGSVAGGTEPSVVEPTPVVESAPEPTPPPEPAPVVTTPAGWYPDPSGRYELRYWDGTQWTEHVARQGQQFTDPPVR
jgi:hypothetical protein